jgi:hypothetical protein
VCTHTAVAIDLDREFRTAHTAVVVVGLVPAQQEGEGLDRHDLRLPGVQAEL